MIQVVYRPKTPEEAARRVARAKALVGTPFIRLPGEPPGHRVLFRTQDGTPIRRAQVEMVFNDALLMDAISHWGEDGPLYRATVDGIEGEVYDYAMSAYAGVEIPEALRKP